MPHSVGMFITQQNRESSARTAIVIGETRGMRRWLVRLRGVLGLSAIGGGAGAILGAAWAVVSSLMTSGTVIGVSVVSGAILWGVFGAFAGGGFGVLLATLGSRHSLEDIAIWRAGLWGASAGAAVPVVTMSLLNGAFPPVMAMLPFLGFCAGLGGLLGSGLVAIAKRAPTEQLGAGAESRTLRDSRA